ncbi:hypothetical protein WMY93_019928 [Mugilogobius chulae]|uniref:Uncharacterized protein n=1 Tax=Mugilogobius chulae TaxID=88201 RepID=A0AAW0NKK7_9GOBI
MKPLGAQQRPADGCCQCRGELSNSTVDVQRKGRGLRMTTPLHHTFRIHNTRAVSVSALLLWALQVCRSSEMLWFSEKAVQLCLCSCLVIGLCCWAEDTGSFPEGSGENNFEEWGSGSSFLHLFHNFPADSPFTTETPGKLANCTQRFVLPSAPGVCWEHVVGPEEFTQSRLLLLQNRAALQAVSNSSGVEEGGLSYELQAKDEVQGIYADHRSAAETMLTMEKVFVSLEEKRKEGIEQKVLTSMKENLISSRTAINNRQAVASILENKFSTLEQSLMNMQLRINKLV